MKTPNQTPNFLKQPTASKYFILLIKHIMLTLTIFQWMMYHKCYIFARRSFLALRPLFRPKPPPPPDPLYLSRKWVKEPPAPPE